MPAVGQAANANLEECAGLETVQHEGPPEMINAKGLNAFMAAKLANAIGKGATLDFTAWQGGYISGNLLSICAALLSCVFPACLQLHVCRNK